jgi:hypothetical protein
MRIAYARIKNIGYKKRWSMIKPTVTDEFSSDDLAESILEDNGTLKNGITQLLRTAFELEVIQFNGETARTIFPDQSHSSPYANFQDPVKNKRYYGGDTFKLSYTVKEEELTFVTDEFSHSFLEGAYLILADDHDDEIDRTQIKRLIAVFDSGPYGICRVMIQLS